MNLTAYSFWALASIVGALLGKYISNPDMLGLDFAITAMFIFLTMAQFESITSSKLKIYSTYRFVIVMMLSLSWFMPSYVAILIASMLATTLGVVMDK